MKNPFLQDRNIFSKVQKPSATLKSNTNQKEGIQIQNKTEQRKSYTATQFNDKPIPKSTNYGPSSAGFTSSYQRQAPKQPSNQYNLGNNNKFTSQKITFGDPTTSQAYNGQRTSGYFNILGTQNNGNRQQISYDKYEPKVNNFMGGDENPFTRNSYAIDKDMKEPKRFDKGYNERIENKIDYEFAPPPINNFSNDYQPNEKKYGYKSTDYDYKYNTQSPYQQQNESYQKQQPYTTTSNQYDDRLIKQNPYLSQQKSQSFKSPPKPNQPPYTPKNDISYQFRQNNYAQLSPIGEVSHHKIQEDSLVNLDGLIQNVQLDKLLAQSKTQQELLKILGMDTSIIKKNKYQQQSIKKTTPQQDNKNSYQYESKTLQQNTYLNQKENQFSKKVYQQEAYVQNNNQYEAQYQKTYQFSQNNFKQDQQPQVLNYAENYRVKDNQMINKSKAYNNNKTQQIQNYNLSQQKQKANDQFFNKNQYQPVTAPSNRPKQNQQEEDDLETIIKKQMEKFILQKQGPLKGKKIFMTASQKIVTKKYNLAPL